MNDFPDSTAAIPQASQEKKPQTPAERAAELAKKAREAAQANSIRLAAANRILTPEDMTAGLLSLPTLLETEEADRDTVLAYGPPGSGKTLLAGLMAEFYNILWIDGDKGLKTLKNNLPPSLLKRIVPIIVPDTSATPIFVHTVLKMITGRQVKICIEHGSEACPTCSRDPEATVATVALNSLPKNWIVVLDSMTQFTTSACAHISHKAFGNTEGDTKDEVKFEFDQWGMLKNIVEKFGNYVKDGEYNFIAISHETMAKQEDASTRLVPVLGSDNSSRNCAKYFGTVCLCNVINNKHTYITNSTYSAGKQTKSRSNVVLEKEAIPSLLHVFRPHEAKELLKDSYSEWFFGKREKPAPQPKEIIKV